MSTSNLPLEQMPAQTVSPKDLMMDSSAPPSTSFTDMSTPSFESPGYFSHDTSPLIATDSDLGPGHEEWESLFPVESAMLPKFDEKVPLCSPKAPSALITPMTRTASSPGASPRNSRSSTRPSSISGVKPRNRDKPLPPIVYDTSDPVAAKRARNTEAARKSRAPVNARRTGSLSRRLNSKNGLALCCDSFFLRLGLILYCFVYVILCGPVMMGGSSHALIVQPHRR
ncbi:CPCA [Coccidioides immitis H538.4]|uniref:CPCA n=1 Tax=Coccidioides immitis H538.4 TaxID=396776 RepID=A0A0J8UHY3_COCIT|nr:CPCA [Coccidioides immitis H538.4]